MTETPLPKIDLSAWHQVGEGGNGKTYENPARPDLILKVNNPRLSTYETVKHEYDVSKAVESLGISTPKMYEMVQVGDAFATLSERIKNKRSLSRICHDEPERTEEIARVFADKAKEFFSTPCDTGGFPSRKEQLLRAIDDFSFLSKANRTRIRDFARSIPENDHCVHGDFQPGNIILSGDKYYWIDLDRFAHGDPMFDIGHLYLICWVYGRMAQVQKIFHMTQEQFHRFWNSFAEAYTGQRDHAQFDRLAGKFACLDVIVRTRLSKPSFAEKIFFAIHVKNLAGEFFREGE